MPTKRKISSKISKAKAPEVVTEAKKSNEKIQRAIKVKEEWRESCRIRMAYDYWEGRQRPPNVAEHEWITINLFYSNLVASLPTLYNTDPYFYIKLRRSYVPNPMAVALYEKRGKIRQAMVNYLKDELN